MLGADLPSGSILHGSDELQHSGRPIVLGAVPHNRPDLCCLVAQSDDNLALAALAPNVYPNPMLPLGLRRLANEQQAALYHPRTRRFMLAIPSGARDQPGEISIGSLHIKEWETFEFVPVGEALVVPRVAARGGALEAALDAVPDAGALLDALEGIEPAVVRDILDMLHPLLTLAELQSLGRTLLDDPTRPARLAALLPQDVWARVALPRLADWLTWRERDSDAGARTGAGHSPRTRKLTLSPDLDSLGANAFRGVLASFGHGCNAYARASVGPRRDVCIISTARNEGLYLLEWLAYHRAIGIEAFFFYSNDNTDGSDDLLAALADAGVITWIENQVGEGGYAQPKANAHAFGVLPDVLDYRWALVIDLDEFFVFNPDLFGSIQDFLRWHEQRAVDAIALNWMMVGSGGESLWRDAPLTRRFRHLLGNVNAHVKTICRPRMFIDAWAHFPVTDDRRSFVFRHSTGDLHSYRNAPVEAEFAPAFSDDPNANYACIYHYFYKSAEEFVWKFSRNRADVPNVHGPSDALREPHFLLAFMQQHEATDVTLDDRIERCAPHLDRQMASLLALPSVAEANEKVKRIYRASMPELKDSFRSSPAVLEAEQIGRAFLDLAGATETSP